MDMKNALHESSQNISAQLDQLMSNTSVSQGAGSQLILGADKASTEEAIQNKFKLKQIAKESITSYRQTVCGSLFPIILSVLIFSTFALNIGFKGINFHEACRYIDTKSDQSNHISSKFYSQAVYSVESCSQGPEFWFQRIGGKSRSTSPPQRMSANPHHHLVTPLDIQKQNQSTNTIFQNTLRVRKV